MIGVNELEIILITVKMLYIMYNQFNLSFIFSLFSLLINNNMFDEKSYLRMRIFRKNRHQDYAAIVKHVQSGFNLR